jgi:ATP-dependent RNA helicase RhlE
LQLTAFLDLGLAEPITKALADEKYTTPTPIQAQTIPQVMQGRDVVGIAQTGTGKTAAFALPILNHLANNRQRALPKGCRVLVLSPTRELSAQIVDSFKAYGRYLRPTVALAIGGVNMNPQMRALAHGVDVLVATPGRLLDLMSHRAIQLDRVEVFVLDEADRMLDMGFIHDIRRIVGKLPANRQTLFFSATMPREITELANSMLKDPVRVAVTPAATTVERIDQRVILVDRAAKPDLLAQLLRSEPIDRVLVFTRTKHGADKVVRALAKSQISSEAIHGNKSQNQRERVLAAFRTGKVRTLVATDIAARGIDVEGISHVVNFDLPNIPESYVHRIGRTARAGAEGVAISFCDGEERAFLRDIEKLIRIKIPSTDQRGVRHAAPPVVSPVNGDAAPATDWSPHESPRSNNGHGKKQQQNRPRQNKPYQGRSEQGRSEQSRSEPPRKPHAAQPPQARNGDQQEQPQRNGQHHQQARNGQHPPKRNGQHQQPRNGQPHQAKRNGHQHQQNRSASPPAGDGSIATVGFMKPTQRQKHHGGGLAARRSAR